MDEFAFRRGRRYGTILVDVETHQLVDVLPDRNSETLAAWLRDHAGAEVVCRDRASANAASPGGYSTLSRYVRTLRDGTAVSAPATIPSPRTISGWIMRPRENPSPRQAAELERVRLACPDITEACNIARAFTDLVRNRRGHLLTEWIRQGEQCGQPSIRSFAGFSGRTATPSPPDSPSPTARA
ncbi:transposase [Streptomyces sp. NPDC059627]